ncbi:hypothetical protein MKW98_013595 [Papaver atlanticum]|uniref:Histone H2A/H2B/H3 domain-containing protein n=1 Tax=Papaver atlanticum TaxID=357466 RepID=A0AAD4RZX5_9MAGN|nr:hypothetical protein MKW98_013595 [Papaver atlanticum]
MRGNLKYLMQVAEKRPYRHKPGIQALREIRKFQKSVDLLLPRGKCWSTVDQFTCQCPIYMGRDLLRRS